MFPISQSTVAKAAVCRLSSCIKASSILACLAFLYWFAASAAANENNASAANRVTQALFPTSPNYLLISYSLMQENIVVSDELPMLRIYGDGRVHVHRPEYLKQSGDYQMYLSAAELQALCLEMMQKNIMAYRTDKVAKEIDQVKRRSKISHRISDTTHSSIEFNLYAVKIYNRDNAEPVAKRKYVEKNVRPMALSYPSIQLLGDFANIERRLNEFIYDQRLRLMP